jgi:hypothetical protein
MKYSKRKAPFALWLYQLAAPAAAGGDNCFAAVGT